MGLDMYLYQGGKMYQPEMTKTEYWRERFCAEYGGFKGVEALVDVFLDEAPIDREVLGKLKMNLIAVIILGLTDDQVADWNAQKLGELTFEEFMEDMEDAA